ncbi:MAG: 2-oxo acid dehydrogenase subunit E2 [Anaerolineales bacterium]|nr:2-oxo acid dehydrogenase subunit E2 [Anaerolineales bacterium]
MAKKVIMPKFGMDQEAGTVAAWLKNEGDTIQKGDPILEVETDKVNMEVEANADGILAGIRVGPGDTVPIGEVIAYILKPGESLPPEKGAPAQPIAEAATAQPAAPPPAKSTPPAKTTPVAERVARSHGIDVQTVAPARAGERITRADVEARLTQPTGGQILPVDTNGAVRAVPAARRLARELGVDLAQIVGTGPAGRIQSQDVRRAAEAQATAVAPVAAAEPMAAPSGERAVRRRAPLTTMRRIIAERLTASVRDIPQFTVSMEVDVGRALEMVADLRGTSGEIKVTLTAFLVKACAWTLGKNPGLNASYGPDAITEWADINIGLAVSVEQGLLVPVIRRANALGTIEIAAQITDLGRRARDGKLQPQEMQDGTFTISNLGMFGVDHFTAIINPPEAAILAVSRTAKVPVVLDDDRIEIRQRITLTLTADHRLVDGAKAAQFLADLKKAIECPGVLL